MFNIDNEYALCLPNETELDIYVDLCVEATWVSPFASMGRTRDTIHNALKDWIKNPDFTCIILTYRFKPVGVLIGFVTKDHPSLDMSVAMELVWYVSPEHRKHKPSMLMVDAFEYWAKTKGATAAIMVGYDPRLEAVYSRKGYSILETSYIKELT